MNKDNRDQIKIDPEQPPNWLNHDDPYEHIDITGLPQWWSDAIEQFREYDLPPYKPPRFADNVIVPPIVQRLEQSYDIKIQFIGIDVRIGDSWGIRADDKLLTTVSRERVRNGFTRYELTSDEFEQQIQNYVTMENSGS